MRLYAFHAGKKFMSKHDFFHLGTSFDDISSLLHVNTTLNWTEKEKKSKKHSMQSNYLKSKNETYWITQEMF